MSSSIHNSINANGTTAEAGCKGLKAFYWVGEEGSFENSPGKVYCTFDSAVERTAALAYIDFSQRSFAKHQQEGTDRLPFDIDAVLIDKRAPDEPHVLALQVEVKNESSLAAKKFTTHRMLIEQIISTTNVIEVNKPSLDSRKITVQRTPPELFAHW